MSKLTMSALRVLRGGSYYDAAWGLRTAFRSGREPEGRLRLDGFRIVVKRRKP